MYINTFSKWSYALWGQKLNLSIFDSFQIVQFYPQWRHPANSLQRRSTLVYKGWNSFHSSLYLKNYSAWLRVCEWWSLNLHLKGCFKNCSSLFSFLFLYPFLLWNVREDFGVLHISVLWQGEGFEDLTLICSATKLTKQGSILTLKLIRILCL